MNNVLGMWSSVVISNYRSRLFESLEFRSIGLLTNLHITVLFLVDYFTIALRLFL